MRKLFPLVLLTATVAIAAPNGYHVSKEIHVGGEGNWDYIALDSSAHRIYVSHDTSVAVVDVDAGKVVGEIPDTPGVHGIAFSPELNRGFTSNGRTNTVTIFDLKTLKTVSQVKIDGKEPDSIRYEPVSGRVFTFNGRSNDSTVIDAKTGNVVGTIPLGSKPEQPALDGKGKLYVNMQDAGEIVEVDARKLAVTKRYPIPCQVAKGLAIDLKNHRLFTTCRGNKIMVVSDFESGKVLATLPIGEDTDGAGFDPSRGVAFSSNGGTLTVIREVSGKWEVVDTVPTPPGARTMVVDEKTHNLYLPTAEFGPPPAATAQMPNPRPAVLPGTFKIVVVGE